MAGNGQGVQSQDIIKVSATSGFTPAPQARDHKVEVAKLIDVSTVSVVKPVRWAVQSGMISALTSMQNVWGSTITQ